MSTTLSLGDRTIAPNDLLPLLRRYRLLPALLRELIIDQAIAPIDYDPAALAALRQAQSVAALAQNDDALIRQLKLQTFKQITWQAQLGSYFLQRKAQLDRVIYSLLRTQDEGLAYELYFRIAESEQTFAAAAAHGEGPEARTGGLVGPVELGALHPDFARLLATRQVGQLTLPMACDGWFIVLRVEELIPAQFDTPMQQRLLDELFEQWLQPQLHQFDENSYILPYPDDLR